MQRTLFSLIIGFLLGLIIAAAVSFYINNAKVPFVDRFADQDKVETPADWNPNASLQNETTSAAADPAPPLVPGNAPERAGSVTPDNDPLAIAVAGGGTGTTSPQAPTETTSEQAPRAQFYVQAGAFSSRQDAEQQRARLALIGTQATITQVTAAGKTINRVRIGPYNTRAEAQNIVKKLSGNGIESTVVGS